MNQIQESLLELTNGLKNQQESSFTPFIPRKYSKGCHSDWGCKFKQVAMGYVLFCCQNCKVLQHLGEALKTVTNIKNTDAFGVPGWLIQYSTGLSELEVTSSRPILDVEIT